MKHSIKIFSIVILVSTAIEGVTQIGTKNQTPLPNPTADTTLIIVSDDKWWPLSQLNQIAQQFLRTNGTMPKGIKLQAFARILPKNQATMCSMAYSEETGKTNWTVNIGYDGKVHDFAKHFTKGGLGTVGPGESASSNVPEIKDLPSFVARLKKQSDALSKYLWDEFLPETREEVSKYPRGNLTLERMEEILVLELTRIVTSPSIYDQQRFSGVRLSQETQRLLSEQVQGTKLLRLNCLLLQDAFPQELSSADPRLKR